MTVPDGANLGKGRKQKDEGQRPQDHPLKEQMCIPQTGMEGDIQRKGRKFKIEGKKFQ